MEAPAVRRGEVTEASLLLREHHAWRAGVVIKSIDFGLIPYWRPDVLVESVDLAGGLDETDFAAQGTSVGTLQSDGTLMTVDVTGAIKALGFQTTLLTLRFSFPTLTDGNGDDDFINLTDPNNQVGAAHGFPRIEFEMRP